MGQVIQEEKRAMPLPLDHWHERLDRHFLSLADARGSGLPVFALEHPLDPAEIVELSSQLRRHLASGQRLGRYWLPWVIYATEIGYGYTGDEYWHSFEEQTPGWQLHHRYALRDWFRKFKSTYHGVEPSGPWAENFSLIAWPITHAMLPKLLQFQFASLLYQQRYRLAGMHTLDSLSVGRLLAHHADETSTRFQQFLQQEELTGRILLGLLGLSPQGGPEPIYPPILQRIVGDLDGVRTTRGWLKDVRTVVDRFKGIGQGSGIAINRSETENIRDKTPSVQHDIRPRVFLRHSGEGKWRVALDIPSFARVAALHAELRSFLKETRCRAAGASDTKPAGWLLSQSRIAVLKSWPAQGSPLLIFEKSNAVLDHLLKTDCVLSSGSSWLFRVGADGIARENLGRTVRPDADYIILSTQESLPPSPLGRECIVECAGIHAFRISLPQSVSAEQSRWLNDIGLQIARSIRVWPAGLPCRGWDGEGQSEWLTTEEPCFGIVHDHPVSSYLVRLNDVSQGVINAPAEGVPTFMRLRTLPAGRHRLHITAHRHGSIADIAQRLPPQGFVDLLVREPEPWIPGVPAHTGLIVSVDPHDADLDEFWENKLHISISGPESHTVECSLTLERGDGEEVFSGVVASRVQLPLTPETWGKRFASFLQGEEAANWRYPEAAVGRLSFKAGELGEFTIRFHRDIQPVRWLTRRMNGSVRLTLLDDTGLEGEAECRSFSMRTPATEVTKQTSEVLAGVPLDPPGMLVIAGHQQHQDALIVSDGLAPQGLQSLGVNPDVSDVESGRVSPANAIRALCLWLEARLVGPLAEIRRKQVTNKLRSAIYAKLCGGQWAAAERTFLQNPAAPSSAEALIHKVHPLGGFAVVLKRDHIRLLEDIASSTAWYSDLARRCKVCDDSTLCEFAVRLAVFPQSVPKRYGDALDNLAKQAVANPEVIRGARFAALLCSEFAPAETEQLARRQRWQ